MKNMRKKSVAVLLGLAVTGLVGASAASLGGVDAESLGADVGDVSSCDSDGVTVEFTTAYESPIVEVRQVTIGAVAPGCEGFDFEIELLDALDASLGSRTGTVALGGGTTFATNFGGANVDAESVFGVAVTISG